MTAPDAARVVVPRSTGGRHRLRRVGHAGLRRLARSARDPGPARDGPLHAVRRVAIATSLSDDVNLDPDAQLLLDALRRRRHRRFDVRLERRSIDWDDYDLTVIRSTWDYTRDRDGYLTWARGIERLLNPVSDHRVLDRQALPERSRGARAIASCRRRSVTSARNRTFPDGRFVVKPTVGAGSIDAEKYGAGDHDVAAAHVRASARERSRRDDPALRRVDRRRR